MTQQQLADALDCVISTVARYENRSRRPDDDTMKRVYVLTAGAVRPNDFYDIDAWEAERIEREGRAELDRQAA